MTEAIQAHASSQAGVICSCCDIRLLSASSLTGRLVVKGKAELTHTR